MTKIPRRIKTAVLSLTSHRAVNVNLTTSNTNHNTRKANTHRHLSLASSDWVLEWTWIFFILSLFLSTLMSPVKFDRSRGKNYKNWVKQQKKRKKERNKTNRKKNHSDWQQVYWNNKTIWSFKLSCPSLSIKTKLKHILKMKPNEHM